MCTCMFCLYFYLNCFGNIICFGDMYTLRFVNILTRIVFVICVLVFTVFCIVCTVFLYCFIYVYYLFCLYQCKDYCHRVKTQLQ
jgi:hypothetical protein